MLHLLKFSLMRSSLNVIYWVLWLLQMVRLFRAVHFEILLRKSAEKLGKNFFQNSYDTKKFNWFKTDIGHSWRDENRALGGRMQNTNIQAIFDCIRMLSVTLHYKIPPFRDWHGIWGWRIDSESTYKNKNGSNESFLFN